MAIIAVDFDETINNNMDIDKGARFSRPFPDAKTMIEKMRADGHKIMIFSCNRTQWIEEWMNHHEIPFDYIWAAAKPIADIYIDDRAIGFRGNWKKTYDEVTKKLGPRTPLDPL